MNKRKKMSKAQIWTVVILGAFVILFIMQRILRKEETHPVMNNESSTTETYEDEGKLLIDRLNCVTCHGADLRGTPMGPTLYALSEHYDREQLINYLRNPADYVEEGRLKEFKEKYRSIMPSYGNQDVKDLGKISDYLLRLK